MLITQRPTFMPTSPPPPPPMNSLKFYFGHFISNSAGTVLNDSDQFPDILVVNWILKVTSSGFFITQSSIDKIGKMGLGRTPKSYYNAIQMQIGYFCA